MKLGIMVKLNEELESGFSDAKKLGFETCQLVCWNEGMFTDAVAARVLAAAGQAGISITAFWCGWPGPAVWDFAEGHLTLGLVPAEYRFARMETLKRGSDFARKIHVDQMITHVGYIPEDPNSEVYRGLLSALRVVVSKCRENGQKFLFETGQETPITLLRTIEDLGMTNVGINLDPANLLMYGKANPVDALGVFGSLVCDVHAKDGEYPTDGYHLGVEKPLGEGAVNFPALIARLKKLGYTGPITIEREITGEEQTRDILSAKAMLEGLI
jgi:L-ribulose-5-phosphate 3-epimerase